LAARADLRRMMTVSCLPVFVSDKRRRARGHHVIQEYAGLNPYWAKDQKDLDHFRQIRNLLTHEQSDKHGFPVVVTKRSHARLAEIKEGLETPVPISRKHKKKVTTIEPDTSLAVVLKVAYEKEFSQLPVVDQGGRFRGLVTENEITRWLGRHVGRKGTTVDLAGVAVKAVLREKEESARRQIFQFESLEEPETVVMGLFMRHPMLEVVLLTASGTKDSPIEGIVTQWDAARYTPG
jgi:predicted transcriptional regulator